MFARLPRQKPQGQSRPNLLSSARNPLASLVTVSDESVSNFTVVIVALLVVVLVRQIQLSHVLWNASTADDAFWNNFWAGNSTLEGRMQFLTNIWISSPLFVDKRICFISFFSLRFFVAVYFMFFCCVGRSLDIRVGWCLGHVQASLVVAGPREEEAPE